MYHHPASLNDNTCSEENGIDTVTICFHHYKDSSCSPFIATLSLFPPPALICSPVL